jgi:purine-binding chemotaxis protein CheW
VLQDFPAQIVVFLLGEQEYALPISEVHEVIRYEPPRPVPARDARVLGVINVRGQIVPVYDISAQFGVTDAPVPTRVVIIKTADRQIGLAVTEVSDVLSVTEEMLADMPAAFSVQTQIVREGDRLIVLVSPDELFA